MAEKLTWNVEMEGIEEEDEEVEDQLENWEDWNTDEENSDPDFLCLFCDSKYSSIETLWEHCSSKHHFDFRRIRKTLGLDFYDSLKVINYVRSQVAANRCWSCGATCQSNKDLQNHLHEPVSLKDSKLLWEDDKYLRPHMQEDSLLHSFAEDEDDEDDQTTPIDREELMKDIGDIVDLEKICIDDENASNMVPSRPDTIDEGTSKEESCASTGFSNREHTLVNDIEARENSGLANGKQKSRHLQVSLVNTAAKEIRKVNENYFGSYGSFAIHREMISDKVRMDAYRGAILSNPSLFKKATVLDVGCGTGILSLFAAQAGASRVVAVEASDKMAAVATQIAKGNGLLRDSSAAEGNNQCTGVINVAHGMIEDLDKSLQISPHSVDVLLSEWMGYSLLYESMLSSVLYARDRWLKPGGAILPDTATILVAGFGRGGTSIPFWENVYGFDMSCIGGEVFQDAARFPIVDVIDSRDIVTDSVVIQTFDLATMRPEEMDFTTSFELELKLPDVVNNSTDLKSKTTSCYGIILWFETGFTDRFCKEMPTVLSTSPYTPKTHWSQTIFTFREPIAMATGKHDADGMAAVGTEACPVIRIESRISIVRAAEHRSIDISLETMGISSNGRKRSWPAQIFNLC
ncbi:probable protein arginine N-methyltransferase 3 [Telopea speciosissima]|uniref:probable protein arginine N-methyltransferase 3 n=1 Tax=Telopea speciosissima TaxID=54955 RepID=UPI001CC47DD2|nr:probable protein arginine N-methyltransferase 3 [Telopea speciosissima]